MRSLLKQMLGLVGWLVVSFTAAAVGAVASIQAKPFYSQLAQPDWAPPPGVFGPVWTALYALMAIAAWWVWRLLSVRAHGLEGADRAPRAVCRAYPHDCMDAGARTKLDA